MNRFNCLMIVVYPETFRIIRGTYLENGNVQIKPQLAEFPIAELDKSVNIISASGLKVTELIVDEHRIITGLPTHATITPDDFIEVAYSYFGGEEEQPAPVDHRLQVTQTGLFPQVPQTEPLSMPMSSTASNTRLQMKLDSVQAELKQYKEMYRESQHKLALIRDELDEAQIGPGSLPERVAMLVKLYDSQRREGVARYAKLNRTE